MQSAYDWVSAGLLTFIVPALIMIGVRLQKQDDTIRRVLSLEEKDDRLGERVGATERDVAVLQAQYATIETILRRIETKLDGPQ